MTAKRQQKRKRERELVRKRERAKRERSGLRDRLNRVRATIARTGKRLARIRDWLRKHRHHFAPRFGVDFAAGRPGPAALKAAGVRFVCRYLSHDSWKNLDAAELRAYHDAALGVVTVWESTANRALSGHAGGIEDARAAMGLLRALGAPAKAAVYFAADWDIAPAQKPALIAYLQGAASVLGRDRTGLYGGYWAIKAAADAGACRLLWQTYAWSGGLLHKGTDLYQYSNGHELAGVEVDYDKALHRDFGGW